MHVPSLVGYTESKKPIYLCDTSEPKQVSNIITGFSKEDHFDALAVFSFLQLAYWRKYGETSADFRNVTSMLQLHDQQISPTFRLIQSGRLGIVTAFDMSKYGRKHCVPYLQGLLST